VSGRRTGLVDPTENYSDEVARKAVARTLETAEGRCCQQLRRSVQGGCSERIRSGTRGGVRSGVGSGRSRSTTRWMGWRSSRVSSR